MRDGTSSKKISGALSILQQNDQRMPLGVLAVCIVQAAQKHTACLPRTTVVTRISSRSPWAARCHATAVAAAAAVKKLHLLGNGCQLRLRERVQEGLPTRLQSRAGTRSNKTQERRRDRYVASVLSRQDRAHRTGDCPAQHAGTRWHMLVHAGTWQLL